MLVPPGAAPGTKLLCSSPGGQKLGLEDVARGPLGGVYSCEYFLAAIAAIEAMEGSIADEDLRVAMRETLELYREALASMPRRSVAETDGARGYASRSHHDPHQGFEEYSDVRRRRTKGRRR